MGAGGGLRPAAPGERLRGQTVREQLRRAGQGSGGPGWFPSRSPGEEAVAQHSRPFPEEAKGSGRWHRLCPQPRGRAAGCRCQPGGPGAGAAAAPSTAWSPSPPPEESAAGPWASPGVGVPMAGVSIDGDKQLWGHQPLPLVLPFLLPRHLCPLCPCRWEPRPGGAGPQLVPALGRGRGRLCRLPRRRTAAGPRAPGNSSPL